MPISDRDYVRGEHPPTCTCKECTERRLSKYTSQRQGNTNRKSSLRTKPSSSHFVIPPASIRRIWRKIPLWIHKLFLSLLVIAGLVEIIRRGYELFTQHTEPLKNTIIFLIEVGGWIWIITVLRKRRYRYRNPKFKLILISIIAISSVCAFAGIEPLSSYKDNIFDSVNDYLEEQRVARDVAEETRIESEEERILQDAIRAERLAFDLINERRMLNGLMPTKWNDELYKLSKAHTQAMSDRGELFHSPMDASYGENAWGGEGYIDYGYEELATVIVDSWMSSPLHRAWILHEPLQTSVVSIIVTPNSQFASWTFWTNEAGEGPELVQKIADEWRRETGESIPWIEWLYMKDYLRQ